MTDSLERVVAGSAWETAEDGPAPGSPFARGGLTSPIGGADGELYSGLLDTVETQIVPRLVLSGRACQTQSTGTGASCPLPQLDNVVELSHLLLTADAGAARSYVDGMRGDGYAVDNLFLDLLAPAARRLGELWEQDLCHFSDVTVGLCRLQQVLHGLGQDSCGIDGRTPQRRVLLATVPGEQHAFGVNMVAAFFRRAGWDVTTANPASRDDLAALVKHDHYDVVGLSVGTSARMDLLAAGIRAIRRSSRNRSIGILVGGPVFVEHPEYVALVGADATAVDGRQAAVQAQNLLALMPQYC